MPQSDEVRMREPPETGGSNATSSPAVSGVERAARSPFTTTDPTAAI